MTKSFEKMSPEEQLEILKKELLLKQQEFEGISAELLEENQLSDNAVDLKQKLHTLENVIADLTSQVRLLEKEEAKAFLDCLSSGKKGKKP